MDPIQVFQQMQAAYQVGNFYKAIDIWTETNDGNYADHTEKINSLVMRCLVAQSKRQNSQKIQYDQNFQQLLQNSSNVLASIYDSEPDIQEISSLQKELVKIDNSNLKKVCETLLLLKKNDYLGVSQISESNNDLEQKLLQIINLLQIKRPDLAQKTLSSMKLINDEDIHFLFAQAYIKIHQGEFQDALTQLDQIKELYSDSLKLINLRATCFIGLKQYDNAQNLLQKLFQLYQTKEQLKDQYEIEVCLNNLIILSQLLGNSSNEYVNALQEINPNSHYFQKKIAANKFFDSVTE